MHGPKGRTGRAVGDRFPDQNLGQIFHVHEKPLCCLYVTRLCDVYHCLWS